MSAATDSKSSVRALFGDGVFRLLFTMRLTANTASQMIGVIVSWQIYELTGSALQLGLIGLIQFLPPLTLTLFAGQVTDRFDRRLVLRYSFCCQVLVSAGFVALSTLETPPVWGFYILLLILAVARTFESPAQQALLPSMIPRDLVAQGISLTTSAQKISALLGPALGGLLYMYGAVLDYGVCVAFVMIAAVASFVLPLPQYGDPSPRGRTWSTVFSGLQFIFKTPVILGLMSLDLLATFFGGVAALLPIFAKDILDVGSTGLGILRAAPAVGALLMAVIIARFPVKRHAGRWLFGGVAAYGVFTIVFGFSENMWLSVFCMLAVGAGDMLGQVLRQTIIQLRTPDAMRGRVAAVSNLSVTVGSQLGQFESGVTAAWFGAVGSVFLGGGAAILIVVVWMRKFPGITKIQHPEEEAVP